MPMAFAESGAPEPRGAHIMDFIFRAAAPVAAKKSDGNRFRPLQVSDLTTNATHKEEESADCVVCGVCESQPSFGLTGFAGQMFMRC